MVDVSETKTLKIPVKQEIKNRMAHLQQAGCGGEAVNEEANATVFHLTAASRKANIIIRTLWKKEMEEIHLTTNKVEKGA